MQNTPCWAAVGAQYPSIRQRSRMLPLTFWGVKRSAKMGVRLLSRGGSTAASIVGAIPASMGGVGAASGARPASAACPRGGGRVGRNHLAAHRHVTPCRHFAAGPICHRGPLRHQTSGRRPRAFRHRHSSRRPSRAHHRPPWCPLGRGAPISPGFTGGQVTHSPAPTRTRGLRISSSCSRIGPTDCFG